MRAERRAATVEETPDRARVGKVPRPRAAGDGAARRRRSALASVLVDQGVSSLTNFAVVLYALHTLSLAQFGAFSIAVGCYIVLVAAVRGLCVEVLLSNYANATEAELRVNARGAVGATALLSGLILAASLGVGLLPVSSQAAHLVVGAAALLIPILVQDAWRYYWFCRPTAWGAACNDAVALLATLAAGVWLSWAGRGGVLAVLGIWSVGAAAAAVFATIQLRMLPDLRRGFGWMRAHRQVGLLLFASGLVAAGCARLVLVLIGSISGLAQVGLVGAALAVLAPINVVTTASRVFLLPETARRVTQDLPSLPRLMTRFSLLLSALPMVALAYAVVPDSLGLVYAGHNWVAAGVCLLPVALWTATSAPLMILSCGLRASGHLTSMLRLDLVLGTAQVTGAGVGAALLGGYGAAWGVCAGNVLTFTVAISTFRRLHRRDLASRATA